jgi:hypothetical protein
MRIELRVHGGFAGIRRPPVVLDTDELAEPIAREAETLATALPPAADRPARGADYMQYDVLVVDARGRHEVTFCEPHVPEQVRALLRLAREAGRAGS